MQLQGGRQPTRLEIGLKPELFDPEGNRVKSKALEYFGLHLDEVRVVHVLTLDLPLTDTELDTIRTKIFTNPVTQLSTCNKPLQPIIEFDYAIWIGYKPGVRDPEGSTALEAIEDLLKRKFDPMVDAVYSSYIYFIRGSAKQPLTFADVNKIASELLANELIQQWKIYSRADWNPSVGVGYNLPKVILKHEPRVTTFKIKSDNELLELSKLRNLALNPQDIPVIRNYFLNPNVLDERKRYGLAEPTDVELEYIAQARSDHCNHNTFRGYFRYKDMSTGKIEYVDNLFKTCIEEPTYKLKSECNWVVSVLEDNAGVAKFDSEHYYVIKCETHNSPSTIEAYGGAITGIVGVYRDPMGTGKGSKLICGFYGYCVAPRDYSGDLKPHLHPRRLLDGVIEGVRDGGNKSGIPTVFGNLYFDHSYLGKCLVFVGAIGLMPTHVAEGISCHTKTTTDGDLIIMAGGRVGKDGIHGVTAASEEYSEHTPAGHVQIGDPYTQKKMHDFLLEARDRGLIEFVTDNGGGGLSSSVGESARFSNGCEVWLDKVPLKYEGLDPWEIWVSESQERMTVAVKPKNLDLFMKLARKHDVECTVIGKYTNSGKLHLLYKDKTCAYVDIELLKSGFPQWKFDAEWLPPEYRGLYEPVINEPENHNKVLLAMLSRPNICSREWITRQYDHEVQGGSVIKPLVGRRRDVNSDAVVLRPVLDSLRGLAITTAINPAYSKIDTYHMVAYTIDETVRRLIAVGGDLNHIGGVDNFCWPSIQYDADRNPDGKYKAAQLVRACYALHDYCLAYKIPLLSGKDSMYIDGYLRGRFGEVKKVSGLPAFQFTATSVIPDIRKCVTMDAKFDGDLIYVLGITRNELGGSEYYGLFDEVGLNVPHVYPDEFLPLYRALCNAIDAELVASAHGIYRGGLAVHLALVAIAGELGVEFELDAVPQQQQQQTGENNRTNNRSKRNKQNKQLTNSQILYSESAGRFIVTVAPEDQNKFEAMLDSSSKRVYYALCGKLTANNKFVIYSNNQPIINCELTALKSAWKSPFGMLV